MSFAERVYEVVRKIPPGAVMSYRQVAELAGSPKAARAVGNVLSKNRNPLVPCHRVICSDGRVGGYAFGKIKKIELLRSEGIRITNKITYEPFTKQKI